MLLLKLSAVRDRALTITAGALRHCPGRGTTGDVHPFMSA